MFAGVLFTAPLNKNSETAPFICYFELFVESKYISKIGNIAVFISAVLNNINILLLSFNLIFIPESGLHGLYENKSTL